MTAVIPHLKPLNTAIPLPGSDSIQEGGHSIGVSHDISLHSFREIFFSEGYPRSMDGVVSAYSTWVEDDVWIVLVRRHTVEQMDLKGYSAITYEDWDEYKALKASKRGNDVYAWRLRERLSPIKRWIHTGEYLWEDKGDPLITFHPWDGRKRRGVGYAFLLTLTYRRDNNGGERDIWRAWEDVGRDWNRFYSALRRRWGRKVQVMRCWEAHRDGYPHIHAVILVPEGREVFRHGKRWRLKEKRELEELWPWGFMDVEAISHPKGLEYVLKYVLKVHNPKDKGKHALTKALCWLYRKQSFSISRDWGLALDDIYNTTMGIRIPFFPSELGGVDNDLISPKHNSNQKWRFYGLLYHEDMEDLCKILGLEGGWVVKWELYTPYKLLGGLRMVGKEVISLKSG